MTGTDAEADGASAADSPAARRVEPGNVPAPGDAAREVFGARLPLAERYASELAGDGVAHGHLGPREVPGLWPRHLLNSALVADLLPPHSVVTDVGSGAGLPGIPLAIRRPDLAVTLLEPMQRRVLFLERCVAELGLEDQVSVHRGRADDVVVRRSLAPGWVVARAVAPLGRLVGWCLPLVSSSGRLLALKGVTAAQEVSEHGRAIAAAGGHVERIAAVGHGDAATRVVVVRRSARGTGSGRSASTMASVRGATVGVTEHSAGHSEGRPPGLSAGQPAEQSLGERKR